VYCIAPEPIRTERHEDDTVSLHSWLVFQHVFGAIALARLIVETGRDVDAGTSSMGRWLAGYGVTRLVLTAAVWDMIFTPFS